MRRFFLAAAMALLACRAGAEEVRGSIDRQLEAAVQSDKVTVVHFWAPWCPNCKAELAGGAWSRFIGANPNVNFVFVTIWSAADGRDLLQRNGVGGETNLVVLHHPNASRARGDKVSQMLGMPISWIPTTWVFREGKLRYAMNYGELRFPMLQQFIKDSSDTWDR
ncbi:MAG TPA: TlpA disulfide reductase family protein [Opitutaceae bacterium]|jgi:thiol-disulfide isomerase/thioredoxin